ncbi:hypothetical protein [Ornithinimicrobium murale]|uniref:hypothetical protein n=1 Tax=Ornithinimicrobium murale TaxID=1050153 RepID=UPI000E0D5880|nr:hypothetical protein [Ornithinimicrobium murale]
MPATITVPEMIEYSSNAGVTISVSEEANDLYAMVSQPGEHIVYLGKDESASRRRAANEKKWAELDPEIFELSGIIALQRRNNTRHAHLSLDGFDAAKAIEAGKLWNVDIPELADPDFVLTTVLVEQFLVRIAVRLGVPIGNSQFASQWESPIGSLPDRLAIWAVTADPFPTD